MFTDEEAEHEPDVPDPGAEAEAVEFDVTSGEDLVGRLPDESEVPGDLLMTFWTTVVVLNVAVFALGLGLLFAFFQGWDTRSVILVLVGLLAAARVALRVRRYERA